MSSKTRFSLWIVILLLVVVAGGFYYWSNNFTQETVKYYLLSDSAENSVPFDGCGVEYLKLVETEEVGGLETALNEMFANKDALASSLANSEVTATVEENVVQLNGSLISVGTCDDPRIKNQIVKTIEEYLQDQEYLILLNNSEYEWRCWSDMSGLCE